MKNFEKWSQRLIAEEGMCLIPYYCPLNKLTIGVGHCLETNPLTPEEKRALGDYMHGITENAAKMLLKHDIARALKSLLKIIDNFEELEEDRQYALLDMRFQLGERGFKQFRKLIWAVNQRDFVRASQECLLSKYALQTPRRAKHVARALLNGRW